MLDAIVSTHGEAVSRLWDGQRTPRQIAMAIRGITPYEVGVIVKRLGLDTPPPAPALEPAPVVVAPVAPEPVEEPAPSSSTAPPPVDRTAAGDVVWSDDLVDWLKRRWLSGASGNDIAEQIGCTRNAVIGRVHRLGLGGRREEIHLRPRLARVAAAKAKAPEAPAAPKAPARPRRSTLLRQMGFGDGPNLNPQPRPEQLAAERSTAWTRADLRAPGERPCTLVELTFDRCRWPLGDPGADEFRYCGGRRSHRAYCAHHGALAYQPPNERRDTRRGT